MQFFGFCRLLTAMVLMMATAMPSVAQEAKKKSIHVGAITTPATLPGQNSAVVYLTIENQGANADRLLAISSPAAQNVTLHRMAMNGQVMAMREMENLPLPPKTVVPLTKGSNLHLMMTGLKRPLKPNETFPLTLIFESAGKLEMLVNVGPGISNSDNKSAPLHHH